MSDLSNEGSFGRFSKINVSFKSTKKENMVGLRRVEGECSLVFVKMVRSECILCGANES